VLNPVYSSTAKFKQQSIIGYTQKTKQLIPVMKEGIKEHFLAIITTCDLVSILLIHFESRPCTVSDCNIWQSFCFVERPAVQGFISYLNPKVEDEVIPKKTCMADAVNTKVEKLDNIRIDLIKVCISFHFLHSFVHIYSGNKFKDQFSLGWLVNSEPSPIHLSQHCVHPFSPWKRQPLDLKEPSDWIQLNAWQAYRGNDHIWSC